MTQQHKRLSRAITMGAVALAAIAVACSDKGAGQQMLGALPAGVAEAQTTKANPGPAKPMPKGVYQMQVIQIPDASGRGSPVAARMLAPAGWRGQGGMIWTQGQVPDGCADPAVFQWSATSQDGKSEFNLYPNELWQASNTIQTQCMYGEFQDMQSYLTAYVRMHVPTAGDFQYRQRPDLLEPQREDIEFKLQLVNNSGTGMHFWPDAGEVTFTYQRPDGTQMKGVMGGTGRFYASQAANPLGGPPLMTLTAQTNTTYFANFPASQFDPQLVEMMRKSLKLDNRWAANYMNVITQTGRQQTEDVRRRAQIIIASGQALTQATIERNNAAANAAIANTYADAPITSGGTDDRSQRERIESIRGVETYDDPLYGGTVQLDNTYDHAWRVQNNDSYILTNDPNFNPGAYNIDAQHLSVTK